MNCEAGETAYERQEQVRNVACQLRRDLANSMVRVDRMIVNKNFPSEIDVLFEELQQTQYVLRDLLGILERE